MGYPAAVYRGIPKSKFREELESHRRHAGEMKIKRLRRLHSRQSPKEKLALPKLSAREETPKVQASQAFAPAPHHNYPLYPAWMYYESIDSPKLRGQKPAKVTSNSRSPYQVSSSASPYRMSPWQRNERERKSGNNSPFLQRGKSQEPTVVESNQEWHQRMASQGPKVATAAELDRQYRVAQALAAAKRQAALNAHPALNDHAGRKNIKKRGGKQLKLKKGGKLPISVADVRHLTNSDHPPEMSPELSPEFDLTLSPRLDLTVHELVKIRSELEELKKGNAPSVHHQVEHLETVLQKEERRRDLKVQRHNLQSAKVERKTPLKLYPVAESITRGIENKKNNEKMPNEKKVVPMPKILAAYKAARFLRNAENGELRPSADLRPQDPKLHPTPQSGDPVLDDGRLDKAIAEIMVARIGRSL